MSDKQPDRAPSLSTTNCRLDICTPPAQTAGLSEGIPPTCSEASEAEFEPFDPGYPEEDVVQSVLKRHRTRTRTRAR